MLPEDAEEFTQSLAQVASGAWRQIALAKRLGVPKALGLTTEQWVNDRLGGYIKREVEERREIVKELVAEGMSQRGISEVLGVDEGTVRGDLRAENSAPADESSNKINGRGAENSVPVDALAVLAADEAVTKQMSAEARKRENEKARAAVRESPVDAGFTTENLNALIAAGCKYSVIYGDPPWTFEVYSGKGKSRSAEEHYDTMTLDEIKALPIGSLAADDCALFLWCVMPQIPEALEVLHAWGFEFKTVAFVWVKTTEKSKLINLDGNGLHWGMGYWTRANVELVLLATRGAPKRIAMDVHQVVVAPVGEHSRKPDKVQQRIESLLGPPSRETHLELFARRPTPGWTIWGNTRIDNLFTRDVPEFGETNAI